MGPRYKVTGCARFFIFFLFFIPAVFFGAAYFRGENGVQIIKDYYHKLIGRESTSAPSDRLSKDTMSVEELQKQLEEARKEIRELKQKLEEKQDEIEKLKADTPPR